MVPSSQCSLSTKAKLRVANQNTSIKFGVTTGNHLSLCRSNKREVGPPRESEVAINQRTDRVKEAVRKSSECIVAVTNNWTSYFQPLDISVNKPYKDFIRNEAQAWYSAQIVELISIVKPNAKCQMGEKVLRSYAFKPGNCEKWLEKIADYRDGYIC